MYQSRCLKSKKRRVIPGSGKSKKWDSTFVFSAAVSNNQNSCSGGGEQLVTLSYSPKFRSQMGINKSCIQHIALENSPQHFTLLRGVRGVPPGSTKANSSPLACGVRGALPPFLNAATCDFIYVLGVTRNSEKRKVVLNVNLRFSDFLQFGNLALWSHALNGTTTQIGHFYSQKNLNKQKLEIFGHFRKSWKTEILSVHPRDKFQVPKIYHGTPNSRSLPTKLQNSSI